MSPLLLDTNAAIWIMQDKPVARAAQDAIDAGLESSTGVFVSPITAWEVGQLVSRNWLDLLATPRGWFQTSPAIPGMRLVELSSDILIPQSFLAGRPLTDPADG